MQLNSSCLRVEVGLGMLQGACMLLGSLIWREPALPRCIVGCWGERIGHLHGTSAMAVCMPASHQYAAPCQIRSAVRACTGPVVSCCSLPLTNVHTHWQVVSEMSSGMLLICISAAQY